MRVWLAILLAAIGVAEEDAVRVRLADVAVLEAHARGSGFAPLLTQDVHRPWREVIAAWLRRVEANSLSGIPTALPQARGLQFRLLDPESGAGPRWAAQADLGYLAPRFARGLGGLWLGATPLALPEADEAWIDDAGAILARFAGLVAYGAPAQVLPLAPLPATADLSIEVAPAALARAIAVAGGEDARPPGRWTALSYRADLVPDGLRWSLAATGPTVGLLPVERALLSRLPASAIDATLIGIEGAAWWRGHATGVATPEIDRWLNGIGIPGGLRALVEACHGTVLVACGPDLPIPSLLVALPRTPALDRLVEGACRHLGGKPPEAVPCPLPIPELPVAVMLRRDATHWVLGTDGRTVMEWGRPGAHFDTQPAARVLLAQAPADACLIGAGDAVRPVQALIALVGLLDEAEEWLEGPPLMLLQRALPVLAALPPGRRWATVADDRFILSGEGGDVLWGLAPAVVAAVILPDLLESRQSVNETAVAQLLRSGIFPAQVQFQGAAYLDHDQDGVGEFGLLSELAGRRAVGEVAVGELRLLDDDLRTGDLAHGYRFAIHVPDHTGAVIGEPPGKAARPVPPLPAVAPERDDRECYWVAYAWPETPASGKHLYALDMTGQVRRRPWDGQVPAWNALYGGKGWDETPTWPLVTRRRR